MTGAGGERVLGEGEMRAGAMVVVEIGCEKSAEMALTEDDDVVEALASYQADQSLDEGVLPGRAGRAQDFLDADARETVAEGGAVGPAAVTHDVLGPALDAERATVLGGVQGKLAPLVALRATLYSACAP